MSNTCVTYVSLDIQIGLITWGREKHTCIHVQTIRRRSVHNIVPGKTCNATLVHYVVGVVSHKTNKGPFGMKFIVRLFVER